MQLTHRQTATNDKLISRTTTRHGPKKSPNIVRNVTTPLFFQTLITVR